MTGSLFTRQTQVSGRDKWVSHRGVQGDPGEKIVSKKRGNLAFREGMKAKEGKRSG